MLNLLYSTLLYFLSHFLNPNGSLRIPHLPECSFQRANSLIADLSITKLSPNKQNTIVHNSQAIIQCRKRWSTDSLFDLTCDISPVFIIVIFLNYLLVNFPKVTSKIKKLLLVALKTLHILLHVKELSTLISLPCKTLDLKPMTLWRGTTLTCILPPREFW